MKKAIVGLVLICLSLGFCLFGCGSTSPGGEVGGSTVIGSKASGSEQGKPFLGEVSVRMVGQPRDAKVAQPMRVCVESVDGGVALEEAEVPSDGGPKVLGKADGTWLQVRVISLPVYSDMTTHDYRELCSTYWVDEDERSASEAVVEIDVSRIPRVELTRKYLAEVAEDREAYNRSGAEMYARMLGEGRADDVFTPDALARSIDRLNRRADALSEIAGRLQAGGLGDAELMELCAEIGRADNLW